MNKSHLIEYNNFRYTAQGAANVTAISFNLDSLDGRTVRYNIANRNTYASIGATSGVTTLVGYGANPDTSASIGNKQAMNCYQRQKPLLNL